MNVSIVISILVASMLALTPVSSYAQKGGKGGGATATPSQQVDRDRIQDRTRLDTPDQDRDRDRDRLQVQDPMKLENKDIYGSGLMSGDEMNQYRKQLQNAKTEQERTQVQAQHEERMKARALRQGKDLVPPGQGSIYGGELMSVEERNEYREQLRMQKSEQERQKLQAQHREVIDQRAKALDIEVEEAE
jgi:hypothetical protein